MSKESKLYFLIDGFNLYHSLCEVEFKYSIKVKWLNLKTLCERYISIIASTYTKNKHEKVKYIFKDMYYFSAFAHHFQDKQIILRHKTYIEALKSEKVNICLGHFKKKSRKCYHCNKQYIYYEEKETDVSIASQIFEILKSDIEASICLITGDTDLISAIKSAKRNYPQSKFFVVNPYNRSNKAFDKYVEQRYQLKKKDYQNSQFANSIVYNNQKIIIPKKYLKN